MVNQALWSLQGVFPQREDRNWGRTNRFCWVQVAPKSRWIKNFITWDLLMYGIYYIIIINNHIIIFFNKLKIKLVHV